MVAVSTGTRNIVSHDVDFVLLTCRFCLFFADFFLFFVQRGRGDVSSVSPGLAVSCRQVGELLIYMVRSVDKLQSVGIFLSLPQHCFFGSPTMNNGLST